MKKVVKFGGTSLADSHQFKKVKEIIEEDETRSYVICSAPGKRFSGDNKITDLLVMVYQLASHNLDYAEVFEKIKNRFKSIDEDLKLGVNLDAIFMDIDLTIKANPQRDYIVSRGEYINGILLATYLGFPFIDSKDLIKFEEDDIYNEEETRKLIQKTLKDKPKAVIPGFYGSDYEGNIRTFSRGGSDLTGSIIADGMDVDLYENWTDVPGFLVVDPHLVPDAKPIERVTYKELRELSYMGALVIHKDAIFPLLRRGINIHIKDTNNRDAKGTLIINENVNEKNQGTITGIAGKKGFCSISIEKAFMNREVGFLRKVISVLESNDINIEHIPSCIDQISLIVREMDLVGKEKKVIEEIGIYCKPDNVKIERNLALLTVVGEGMVNSKGISAKIFDALASSGINIRMISQGASEISINIGILEDDLDDAIRAIYRAFFGGDEGCNL